MVQEEKILLYQDVSQNCIKVVGPPHGRIVSLPIIESLIRPLRRLFVESTSYCTRIPTYHVIS